MGLLLSKMSTPHPGYSFKQALNRDKLSIIAEIKKCSPSAGALNLNVDVAKQAKWYELGGATCLSVLTESSHFQGSADDLRRVKQATNLPILRKDFITTPQEIEASLTMGAKAILLIVADLKFSQLKSLQGLAIDLGLDAVVEVRNKEEFELAMKAGAYMIAINQRSQPKAQEFSLNYDLALKMSRLFADYPHLTTIAASGIGTKEGTSIKALSQAGYDAVLIGEALMRAQDPTLKLQSLLQDI